MEPVALKTDLELLRDETLRPSLDYIEEVLSSGRTCVLHWHVIGADLWPSAKEGVNQTEDVSEAVIRSLDLDDVLLVYLAWTDKYGKKVLLLDTQGAILILKFPNSLDWMQLPPTMMPEWIESNLSYWIVARTLISTLGFFPERQPPISKH